ncbi:MAG: hypothetical protein M2R45_04458 [Verrucomicrobia subdivision 3 bacterium]|nr:hypothetical protein [Limisphaerales bacterium]MCS1415011.1 hypothetical protein [Limisphaerales bacterium]
MVRGPLFFPHFPRSRFRGSWDGFGEACLERGHVQAGEEGGARAWIGCFIFLVIVGMVTYIVRSSFVWVTSEPEDLNRRQRRERRFLILCQAVFKRTGLYRELCILQGRLSQPIPQIARRWRTCAETAHASV